jgi:hypothetical protein
LALESIDRPGVFVIEKIAGTADCCLKTLQIASTIFTQSVNRLGDPSRMTEYGKKTRSQLSGRFRALFFRRCLTRDEESQRKRAILGLQYLETQLQGRKSDRPPSVL